MDSVLIGILASVASAITATIIARSGITGTQAIWMLVAQYTVGALCAGKPKARVVPLGWHAARLCLGLWAFGGYYWALTVRGANTAEVVMLVNLGPLIASVCVSNTVRCRLGALIASMGAALLLRYDGWAPSVAQADLLALTAGAAYAGSIILLGRIHQSGESRLTANAIYNWGALTCTLISVGFAKSVWPPSWLSIVCVGILSAFRLAILSRAATSPEHSARVFVLSNLAFVWLAMWQEISRTEHSGLRWMAIVVLLSGCMLANAGAGKKSEPSPARHSETRECKPASSTIR